MTQVSGVGGIFLRAADPEKLFAWYEKHLGLKRTEGGFIFFSEGPREMTILTFFPADTKYFGSAEQKAMVNLRVNNLDVLLDQLRSAGVTIDPRREDYEYGRFAWIHDLEGNRVELWEPPPPTED
jgi:catechol 2,3-dioxygenase-like lactoylglutathione lyase family enzyme